MPGFSNSFRPSFRGSETTLVDFQVLALVGVTGSGRGDLRTPGLVIARARIRQLSPSIPVQTRFTPVSSVELGRHADLRNKGDRRDRSVAVS